MSGYYKPDRVYDIARKLVDLESQGTKGRAFVENIAKMCYPSNGASSVYLSDKQVTYFNGMCMKHGYESPFEDPAHTDLLKEIKDLKTENYDLKQEIRRLNCLMELMEEGVKPQEKPKSSVEPKVNKEELAVLVKHFQKKNTDT